MNCRNNKVSSDIEEDQQKDEALDSNENQKIEFEWDSFEYRFNICLGLSFEQIIGSYSVRKEYYMEVYMNTFEKSKVKNLLKHPLKE